MKYTISGTEHHPIKDCEGFFEMVSHINWHAIIWVDSKILRRLLSTSSCFLRYTENNIVKAFLNVDCR